MSEEAPHPYPHFRSHIFFKQCFLKKWLWQRHLLGEVSQILNDLGNESESPRRAVVRVLLHQAEKAGRHDGWAQEAEEQRGADEPLADVLLAAVQALLLPGCEHFLQLTRENTGEGKESKTSKQKRAITQESTSNPALAPRASMLESSSEEGPVE